MNLLKGGQGRDEHDMAASAIAAIVISGLALGLVIALVIRAMFVT